MFSHTQNNVETKSDSYVGWERFPEGLGRYELVIACSPTSTRLKIHAGTFTGTFVLSAPRVHVLHNVTYVTSPYHYIIIGLAFSARRIVCKNGVGRYVMCCLSVCLFVCLSVCLSVTHVHCAKTAPHIIRIFSRQHTTLVFFLIPKILTIILAER